jgi:hypothetical protein
MQRVRSHTNSGFTVLDCGLPITNLTMLNLMALDRRGGWWTHGLAIASL